jgi:hypothetical protein
VSEFLDRFIAALSGGLLTAFALYVPLSVRLARVETRLVEITNTLSRITRIEVRQRREDNQT